MKESEMRKLYIKKIIDRISSSHVQEEVVDKEKRSMNECVDIGLMGVGQIVAVSNANPVTTYLISTPGDCITVVAQYAVYIRDCDLDAGQRETNRR
jgi:hypothetical protein